MQAVLTAQKAIEAEKVQLEATVAEKSSLVAELEQFKTEAQTCQ